MPRVQFWKEYSLKYFTSFLVYFSFLFSQKCWVCVRLYQWIVRNRTLPHTKEVIYYTLFTPSCNTRTHTSLGSHILCCVEKLHRQWRGKVTHSIMRSLNKSRFLWCMSESSYWQQLYTLFTHFFPRFHFSSVSASPQLLCSVSISKYFFYWHNCYTNK